jgi:hypothetical protein
MGVPRAAQALPQRQALARRVRRVPGNHPAVPRDWFRGVPEGYAARADTRGRPEGRPYP